MIRVIREGLLLVVAVVALWFGLSRIPWMTLIPFREVQDATETRVGTLVWSYVRQTNRLVRDRDITAPVEALVAHLCTTADLRRCPVESAVVQSAEVNAFALPGRRLVLTTGMLGEVTNEAELAAVIAHELAHVERRHSMQVLAREIGLSVLVTAGGGRESTVLRDAAKTLTSSAYDRSLESEADRDAVRHLAAARIPAGPFADLMYRLAVAEPALLSSLTWLSSHPDSGERAEAILTESARYTFTPRRVLSPEQWRRLQASVKAIGD